MNTSATIFRFTQLDQINKTLNVILTSRPFISNNTLIITTSSGVYEYHFDSNKMDLIVEYGDKYIGNVTTQFMDHKNNVLHLFGCGMYHSINLKTKQIEKISNKLSEFRNCSGSSLTSYIPSPINELHILDSVYNHHFKYNFDNQNSLKLNSSMLETNCIKYPKLIYVPFKQQLMIFGSSCNDKIFYFDVTSDCDAKWNLYPLQMIHKPNSFCFDCLLAFDTLVFTFYFYGGCSDGYISQYDIWCLDLVYNKWYKSKYKTPNTNAICHAIKGKNNSVHLFNFYCGDHFMMSLYDLIPNEVKISYSKYYQLLVIGYIKVLENNNMIPTIPYVLKQLIWRYFPSFL